METCSRWGVILLGSLLLPHTVKAANINITVSGNVISGEDYTGVFGFPPGTNLANQPYTLAFTFNNASGAQLESCTYVEAFADCMSNIDGSGSFAPGFATLTIGQGFFVFGNNPADSTQYASASIDVPDASYNSVVGVTANNFYDEIILGVSGSSTPQMNFDWRSGFAQALDGTSLMVSSDFAITTIPGNPVSAIGTLGVSNIEESGLSCPGDVTLTVNTTNTEPVGSPQPNILLVNDSTQVGIAVTNPPAWYSINISYLNNGMYATYPETVAISDDSGVGTFSYYSAGDNVTDQVTAAACGSGNASQPLPIYDYSVFLDADQIVPYDIHQSQVSDDAYTNDTALPASGITAFLNGVRPGPSFLRNFYFVNTAPNTVNSGFQDVNNDGKYTSADDGPAYCSNGATNCVPENTLASASLSFSAALEEISIIYGVNPELLLVKLQVEKSLNSFSTLSAILQGKKTSYKTLNKAVGCGRAVTFFSQLECGAMSFINNYNKTPSEPYFFPVTDGVVDQSIQYASVPGATCIDDTSTPGCVLVGFLINDAATTAQFNYTPFVQTTTGINSGGVRAFETVWYKYANNKWYQ